MGDAANIRRRTSRALSGLALPAAFAAATVAAETVLRERTHRRPGDTKDLRRVADKARKLEAGR